jgi:hypothetical protein
VSRGEGELLTVPKPRAVSLLSVYLAVKPVGKPDAGNRLVRFDERGWETERCRMAQATAPILDSTISEIRRSTTYALPKFGSLVLFCRYDA